MINLECAIRLKTQPKIPFHRLKRIKKSGEKISYSRRNNKLPGYETSGRNEGVRKNLKTKEHKLARRGEKMTAEVKG